MYNLVYKIQCIRGIKVCFLQFPLATLFKAKILHLYNKPWTCTTKLELAKVNQSRICLEWFRSKKQTQTHAKTKALTILATNSTITPNDMASTCCCWPLAVHRRSTAKCLFFATTVVSTAIRKCWHTGWGRWLRWWWWWRTASLQEPFSWRPRPSLQHKEVVAGTT